jgi:DNA polymerase
VAAAQRIVDLESARLLTEFHSLTGLDKIGSPKLIGWCESQGVKLDNMQKGTIASLLATPDEEELEDAGYESLAGSEISECELDLREIQLPEVVRKVLGIRQVLGGAAIKKLRSMQACVCYDGRARYLYQYHAAHSGRWGGRLLQPHNFPRQSIAGFEPDAVVAAIMSGEPAEVETQLSLPALEAVARSLRHALVSDPGKVFVAGDYKAIEAVIILALAGHRDKALSLAQGLPVYFEMAEDIYNKPRGTWAVADKELYKRYKEVDFVQEYTIGKNTVLGCGFQMGPAKFHARYCPSQPIEFAERTVESYRKKWAPLVPPVWYDTDEVSLAVARDGKTREVRGVTYRIEGEWMTAQLPSKWQKIWYPRPHIGEGKFGNPCWKSWQTKQGAWIPVDMYGGLETENNVQGMGHGVLCAAMVRLDRAGFDIVHTAHDQAMIEVDEDKADEVSFAKLMTEPSQWADKIGIPVAVETWTGTRYKK